MSAFLYWFGVFHLAAYALAGFSFAFILFASWIIGRLKLNRDFIQAAHRMFQERNASKRSGA